MHVLKEQAFKDAAKIKRIIESCENLDQLYLAHGCMERLHVYHGFDKTVATILLVCYMEKLAKLIRELV